MTKRTKLVVQEVEDDDAASAGTLAVDIEDDDAETPPPADEGETQDADTPATAPSADGPATTPPASTPAEEFHILAIVDDTWTGDSRTYTGVTIAGMPLPVMADDKTAFGHDGAKLVGYATRGEKIGAEVHLWGHYLTNPDERAGYLIGLARGGNLRGVSSDLDFPGPFEADLLFPPVEPDDEITYDERTGMPNFPDPEVDAEGNEVLHITEPRTRIYGARVRGCTILPFPALTECYVEGVLTASAGDGAMGKADLHGVVVDYALTAAGAPSLPDTAEPTTIDGRRVGINPPVVPPAEWFDNPFLPLRSPLTITDQGRILGHLAGWGECHVAFPDVCVQPPRTLTNYAHFHVGEIMCDDGSRVACGRLTLGTGHADKTLNAAATLSHYDNTGTAIADVVAGEDEHGIWLAGAVRPGTSMADIRKLMSSPPSGDWRRVGGNLELIAALAVNVPGFNGGERVSLRASGEGANAVVASLIVTSNHKPVFRDVRKLAQDRAMADRIAKSIGRPTTADKIAALRERVHAGRS